MAAMARPTVRHITISPPAGVRALRPDGRPARQVEATVAAPNIKRAAELLGCSVYYLRGWGTTLGAAHPLARRALLAPEHLVLSALDPGDTINGSTEPVVVAP